MRLINREVLAQFGDVDDMFELLIEALDDCVTSYRLAAERDANRGNEAYYEDRADVLSEIAEAVVRESNTP